MTKDTTMTNSSAAPAAAEVPDLRAAAERAEAVLRLAMNRLASSRGAAHAYGDGEVWDRYENCADALAAALAAQPAAYRATLERILQLVTDLTSAVEHPDNVAHGSAAIALLQGLLAAQPAAEPIGYVLRVGWQDRAYRAALIFSRTQSHQYSTELCAMLGESLQAVLAALEQAQRERDEARQERDTEQALRARYLRERDEARAALEALTAHHHSITGAAAQEAQR